jgi:hypothetical protein
LPPFNPPCLPRSIAWGSFPSFGSGNGWPSNKPSPMLWDTTAAAVCVKSNFIPFERIFILISRLFANGYGHEYLAESAGFEN